MLFATCIFSNDLNVENNVFDNPFYGIKISKPQNWKFEKYQNLLKVDTQYIYKNEELSRAINKSPVMYCVIITKYSEPYNDINPTLKITPIALKDGVKADPYFILDTYLSSMKELVFEFEIIQDVKKTVSFNGNVFYQVKSKYGLKDNHGKLIYIRSSITIIIRESIIFIIQTTCKNEGEDMTDKEFDDIIHSISFY